MDQASMNDVMIKDLNSEHDQCRKIRRQNIFYSLKLPWNQFLFLQYLGLFQLLITLFFLATSLLCDGGLSCFPEPLFSLRRPSTLDSYRTSLARGDAWFGSEHRADWPLINLPWYVMLAVDITLTSAPRCGLILALTAFARVRVLAVDHLSSHQSLCILTL